MNRSVIKKVCSLLATIIIIPGAALALEVIAPCPTCVLTDGKVIVVGLEDKAERGSATFDGQTTAFRVRDGKFTVALNLGPGEHEVTFTAGEETLTTSWTIIADAKTDAYEYHPEMQPSECKACHEEGVVFDYDTDLSGLCGRCHERVDKEEYVHGPVAMGLCTACHDPHGSNMGSGLRLKTEDLCQDCHNQPITQKHRETAGDETDCIKCHEPHTSDKRYMLK